ncbi:MULTISPECIES: AAA family ATPase [Pontibacillus]|uniref:Rad50/SbcC-type AAA domain-containing protein n=1 Tax=Pontibacillus marinus BH030004 = DSM 16465 TaxID=1385511 RepID=A0A0A5GA58_9BACI|nr:MULTISPECIES: hypothetical protein [Pontibacillus]KGX90036.1 hypothetical protein N783_02505 [Pontibacillus marinus BH030004 = DSM 16465]QHE50899.1 hypothetical protein GS400_02070 [Pontibacillus sp. HMF3514]
MLIKKVAIGNEHEAFIENRFSDKMNIISSDDNNRGKTILIQGMMYALGNNPVFPSTFNYTNYYYIVEFLHNDIIYKICRNKDLFFIQFNESLIIFENVSELKRYWHKNISSLPIITKNDFKRIVDPELYLQVFFVGQDKKDTSNIANKGLYNKEDFKNMLYSLAGIKNDIVDIDNIKNIRQKISNLKDEKKLLLKQSKILKSQKKPIAYLSSTNDRINFKDSLKKIEKVKGKLTELNKDRNKNINRKFKCEITIKELNSLNRNLESGELVCLECGSNHIGYKATTKQKYSFDISTPEIRKQILESLNNKIQDYQEEVERITLLINKEQSKLKELLSVEEISLESLVAYKDDVLSVSDAENKLNSIEDDLKKLENQKKEASNDIEGVKEEQNNLYYSILSTMNESYNSVDPLGNIEFDNIFTKKTETYSGSEQTIYHLVKVYSLAKILKHDYPIVVDSFRAEDLSTKKEKVILDLFKKLDTQIILTTTLKSEEIGKYDKKEFDFINHIDYSNHSPSKILQSRYVDEFKKLLGGFSINFR